jgi:multiple sugar transport system ATP-binding protein
LAEVILQNMVKKFGDFTAVQGLDLTIKDGEFLVLLGPSGCGKTTTLRCISGLEIPTSGAIKLDGVDVTDKRASQRDIAFVFQLYALYPHMNAYKNIAFPLKAQGVPKAEIEKEIARVVKLLKIEHILNRKPKHLSGGDMQRVALGRALVRRPKVFLLDEPIGTLDAAFREEMRTELKALHVDIKATSVYVTHDQEEAMSMGDRIAVMNQGVLQQIDEPHEIYANPVNLFVAQFIGSPGMNFLTCVPETGDGGKLGLRMQGNSDLLELPANLQKLISERAVRDHNLVLGVRPEDTTVTTTSAGNSLPAEVYVTEKMGSYRLVDLKYGEEILRARTSSYVDMAMGQNVRMSFDMDRVRLFDSESGQSIMN